MDIKWTCPCGKTNTVYLIEVLDFCQICECGREYEVNIEVTVTEVNKLKD
jgi:hypothetical protein